VQQNSATAEESAAASEEMSGQSIMLEELISRFKLRDAGNSFQSLPAAPISEAAAPQAANLPPASDSDLGDFGKY
ncbi:MAG: methyl-accepting chemotaxis protein, partial [Oscillospiraceae bacterium]|nr:methyl-accepting chemotaxis protein [Oscillospiraceae bacterium]MCL2280103.1 methyl-accepting chemotaxis protein [Oscillospiraceae bacterium]